MNPERDTIGLCQSCQHVRRIENRRGSVFILCEKSTTDPDHYPRYPPLPVRVCGGYVPHDSSPSDR